MPRDEATPPDSADLAATLKAIETALPPNPRASRESSPTDAAPLDAAELTQIRERLARYSTVKLDLTTVETRIVAAGKAKILIWVARGVAWGGAALFTVLTVAHLASR